MMNLRAIRVAKGYPTQADLAEALGVDQATVQRMEAMAPNVTLRQFIQAAEILGVSLAEIFADERTAAELLLVDHWRSLPASQQAIWVEHLRLAAEAPLQADG